MYLYEPGQNVHCHILLSRQNIDLPTIYYYVSYYTCAWSFSKRIIKSYYSCAWSFSKDGEYRLR